MKKLKIKKRTGFTLIELVITIVLIATLSAISVPIYNQHTKKAKYAECYTLLASIRDAELMYRSEYSSFYKFGYTANEKVLGINASSNKYFTWFSVDIEAGGNLGVRFIARVSDIVAWSTKSLTYDMSSGINKINV